MDTISSVERGQRRVRWTSLCVRSVPPPVQTTSGSITWSMPGRARALPRVSAEMDQCFSTNPAVSRGSALSMTLGMELHRFVVEVEALETGGQGGPPIRNKRVCGAHTRSGIRLERRDL